MTHAHMIETIASARAASGALPGACHCGRVPPPRSSRIAARAFAGLSTGLPASLALLAFPSFSRPVFSHQNARALRPAS